MSFIVGFTGTRQGLTDPQRHELKLLYQISDGINQTAIEEFHHGDCEGADAQAHDIFDDGSIRVIIHPCTIRGKRAFKKPTSGYVILEFPPLERNQHIVDACDVLICCPKENTMINRSGTWSTYRCAFKASKEIWLILPDGKVIRRFNRKHDGSCDYWDDQSASLMMNKCSCGYLELNKKIQERSSK